MHLVAQVAAVWHCEPHVSQHSPAAPPALQLRSPLFDPFPPCRAQLGLGDGAALDFGTSADDALRATVETLEQRNRTLQSENKRLRVERVRTAVLAWGQECCTCFLLHAFVGHCVLSASACLTEQQQAT